MSTVPRWQRMGCTVNRLAAVLLLCLALPAAAGKADPAAVRAAVIDIANGQGVAGALSRLDFMGAGGQACDALVPVVLRGDVKARRNAAEAFARFAEPRHVQALLVLAEDMDVSLRVAAAKGLGHAKLDHPALRQALGDKALGVRREAARALGALKSADAGKALLEAAGTEAEPEVREAMLVAATAAPFPGLPAKLEGYLHHSSETTRMAAARALCLLGAAPGLAVASEKLGSESRYDRRDGVLLLEGAPLKASGPLLRPLLAAKPPDYALAAPAARVLAQAGDERAREWLVLRANDASGAAVAPLLDAIEALKVTDEDRQRILRKNLIVP